MGKEIENVLRKLERKNKHEKKTGLATQLRMRAIPPETGLFLYLLVKLSRAKRILEIGTSQGYSTTWLAWAASEVGAKVISLEVNPSSALKAQKNLREAKLDKLVNIKIGDARKILPDLEGKFDFAFIDAEKKDYLDYFNLVHRKLKPGGLIIADNIVSHSEALCDYREFVQSHPDFQSLIVPIGSGEMLSYKVG